MKCQYVSKEGHTSEVAESMNERIDEENASRTGLREPERVSF